MVVTISGTAYLQDDDDELGDEDLVIDFGKIKSSVGKWIDSNWDHALLLNSDDPFLNVLEQIEIRLYLFDGHDPTSEIMATSLFPI